ncbi:MAG: recombination protein RecR [Candidatus Nomurabacteria bacterium]|nr:MAG: recombination protein RecR [Candidatus Nomurabacteria bacterium]
MSTFDKLVAYFEKFPGVGVRQAKRFAFHVLTLKREQVSELADLIGSVASDTTECADCHRFFSTRSNQGSTCSICADPNRDNHKLLVVTNDGDIQAIERSGVYDGVYFVLGGTIPLLNAKEEDLRIRNTSLKALANKRSEQTKLEVILGFAVNPDGENTSRYVESLLRELVEAKRVNISHLGRGLSTGSELEYADAETIKSALRNRV